MKKDLNIGFVGAGNMAEALVRGLIAAGTAPAQIVLSDSKPERLKALSDELGTQSAASNVDLARQSQVVVLAVKPQGLYPVLAEIGESLADRLLISILAGVSTAALEQGVPRSTRVVRAMPNTPALIGQGATAICAGQQASEEDMNLAENLFRGAGLVTQIAEGQMDAVTGLSGSGPAYVFAMIEALADAGVAEGLPRPTALALATQTVLGAAQLVKETGEHPAALKDKVCSPGGTTIAGMKALEAGGVRAGLMATVAAAAARSKELGQG